jgi:hypothetical protein
MTNLWLDDIREAPPGWIWAKTAEDALRVLASVPVSYASLDCDLESEHENGVWFVKQMAKFSLWPEFKPGVHSSNWKLGSEMLKLIRRLGPYDEYATRNGLTRRPRVAAGRGARRGKR